MNLRWLGLAALAVLSVRLNGQTLVRYDGNATQTASNVPAGAAANIMTVPYARVSVCAYPPSGSPCTNTVQVYSDQAGTQPISQPLTTDGKGRYGFWIAPGSYNNSVVSGRGVTIGDFPFTVGGSGGGGAGNPGGTNLQMQYNNAGTAFGGAGAVVDTAVDPTLNSLRIPKLSTVNNITTPNSYAVSGPSAPVVNYYINPPGTDFPQQVPNGTFYTADRMLGRNDFFGTSVHRLELWNTCRYFLSDTGKMYCGPNTSDVYRTIITHSPSQIGGVDNTNVIQWSGGDTVGRSLFMLARRSTTGFDEGLEPNRVVAGFNFSQPHGTITKGATDAFGHTQLTMGNDGNTPDGLGVGEMLIDLTKAFSPAGNVTLVEDPVIGPSGIAEVVTVDSTLKAALDGKFGTSYHTVTIVGGADMQRYNGACPSAAIGVWTQPDGTEINPYNFSPDDVNTKTNNQCITVSGDTSSITDGTPIGIWGRTANAEYTYVVHKADSTHLVVRANFPHIPTEVITWGAGLGYGLSSPAYTPAGTITTGVYISRDDIYQAFPIMGWDSANSKIYVYMNADTSGGELKLPIYGSQTPFTAGVYTATVSGGVVTSVATSNRGNYGVFVGTTNHSAGTIPIFPPPSVTLGGSGSCIVAPTFSFTAADQGGYTINLLSGGSGCPSDLTITPQATYLNPIKTYPMTILANVQDPVTHTATGWMKTQYLASSEWATGDMTTEVTLADQYATDINQEAFSPLSGNSRRFGAHRRDTFYYPQNGAGGTGNAVNQHMNATPTYYYFGDASTGYNRSKDPTKWLWANGFGPAIENLDGVYSEGIRFSVPPYVGGGRTDDGTLFAIYCATEVVTNHGGYPCDRTSGEIKPRPFIFRDFSTHEQVPYMRADGHLGTVDIGPKITEGLVPVCKQNGIDCPTLVSYTINSYTGPMSPTAGNLYYLGDAVAISSNSAMGTVVSKTCKIKRFDLSETYISGAVPSGENVDFWIDINGVGYTSGTFSWGGSGRNVFSQLTDGNFVLNAGDVVRTSFHTPGPWTTPPGVISFTNTIYCALP